MIRYFWIRRLYSFVKKYGFLIGPFSVIKWICKKDRFKRYANNISKADKKAFMVKKDTFFNEFYSGNIKHEVERILNGERKLLFYNNDDINKQLDIKTRWELNRSQHLPILALDINASNNIGNLKHENLGEVFHETNAMEVSIVAINVLTAYQLIDKENGEIDDVEIELFLQKCLTYIMSNIEVGLKYSNNHYFFNLLGIMWITECIVGNEYISKIRSYADRELHDLLSEILNKDGSLYEGSTHYHKYVTDSLLSLLVLTMDSKRYDWKIKYAKSMYLFCCYASFNNKLIGFGDNDSGRILALPEYFNYYSNDLTITHRLSKKIKLDAYNDKDEKRLKRLNYSKKSSFGLIKLEDNDWHVVIRCDQIRNKGANKVIGSHYHNDQLSVLINHRGKELFVDKGTYSYIQKNETRLENIKTSSHNTLSIKNEEQNIIYNDWRYNTRRAIGKIKFINDKKIIGEHIGYINCGVVHRRMICLKEKGIEIEDTVIKRTKNEVNATIIYNIHPNYKAKKVNSYSIMLTNGNDNVKISFLGECQVNIISTFYSKEYGMLQGNSAIAVEFLIDKKERKKVITTQIRCV